MVISKTTADITHDAMLKRVEKLIDSVDKDDKVTRTLLERVLANEAFLIYHKVTKDEAEADEVSQNWKKLVFQWNIF